MSMSLLDGMQVLKSAYDDASTGLKVKSLNSMLPNEYDYVAVTYPTGTQEVYTFKSGGSGGTSVGVITVNYVDSSKADLLNAARI